MTKVYVHRHEGVDLFVQVAIEGWVIDTEYKVQESEEEARFIINLYGHEIDSYLVRIIDTSDYSVSASFRLYYPEHASDAGVYEEAKEAFVGWLRFINPPF